MNVHHNNHSPPPDDLWHLRLELHQNAKPCELLKAHRIIDSYLDASQRRRWRIKKGIAVYCLDNIDPVINRSIAVTVADETLGQISVTLEGVTCQDHP